MVDFLQEAGLPFTVVLTKADKLSKSRCLNQERLIRQQLALSDETETVISSSAKGTGIERLRDILSASIGS
jgi:GTP-binding protein